jgi:hypothetical protein
VNIWNRWASSLAVFSLGVLAGRGMAMLDILALVAVLSLAYFAKRVIWSTRNAGPFRVREIPLVPPQSGGG